MTAASTISLPTYATSFTDNQHDDEKRRLTNRVSFLEQKIKAKDILFEETLIRFRRDDARRRWG